MTDNVLKTQAFKLKGRLYTLTVLQLLETQLDEFDAQLTETVATAPRLFDRAPVVLECSLISSSAFDLSAFCRCLQKKGMIPVGIQGGDLVLNTLAQANGLAVFNPSSTQDRRLQQEEDAVTPSTVDSIKTKTLLTPVRSGQQVVSKGGDLVIAASVSHGAELLADGHIHVYGTLRGRALAGIAGDQQARIFCQSLDAELVSIAGHYCLSDGMKPVNGPCQIFLQDDRIQIEPL